MSGTNEISETPLQVDWRGPVLHLTLARPAQGNALSAELVALIDAQVAEATRRNAHALVISGAGRHFCTGFDLSGIADETDDSLLARFVRIELMLQRVARAPFLTIAEGHGRVMGAGADLFAACDVRIAQAGASFAFPGARGFGLVLGSRRLASRVGATTALDWIENGRTVSTEEALASGLVTTCANDASSARAAVAHETANDAVRRNAGESATGAPAPHPFTLSGAQPDAIARQLRQAVAHDSMPPGSSADDDARDLALLAVSAAQPGLRQRIAAYVQQLAGKRAG